MATLRQERLAKNVVNSRSMQEAMVKSGYAISTAKTKSKRTRQNDNFQRLLKLNLPDTKITKKHSELLDAQKVISANVFPDSKDGKPVNDFIEVPDNQTQIKAVELAYKVKNKLQEKVDLTSKGESIVQFINDLPRPKAKNDKDS